MEPVPAGPEEPVSPAGAEDLRGLPAEGPDDDGPREPREGDHAHSRSPEPDDVVAETEVTFPADEPSGTRSVQEPAPAAETAPEPAPGAVGSAPQSPLPVREIPAAAFHRLVSEMQGLQAAIEAPDETPVDADPANLVFLRKTQADQRERRTKRLGFLRSFLDAVRVGGEGAPKAVHPGALLVLEFDGQADDTTLYTVAELPTEDAETISPSSPLGHALMWQPTGRSISYDVSGDRSHEVVVREIRA